MTVVAVVFLVALGTNRADARPLYQKVLYSEFPAYRSVRCAFCHVKKRERNPIHKRYAKAFADALGGRNIKDADKIREALQKVKDLMPAAPDDKSGHGPYAATPNNAPMPAVTPIASAPQNETRVTAFATGALPARAEMPPNSARLPSDVAETTIAINLSGERNAVTSGNAAPTANVTADVRAA